LLWYESRRGILAWRKGVWVSKARVYKRLGRLEQSEAYDMTVYYVSTGVQYDGGILADEAKEEKDYCCCDGA
jgi:hypothetical protein